LNNIKKNINNIHNDIILSKIEQSSYKAKSPLPFNTVSLLKFASAHLGISPNNAMHSAEKLYLGGFIT